MRDVDGGGATVMNWGYLAVVDVVDDVVVVEGTLDVDGTSRKIIHTNLTAKNNTSYI